MDNTIALIVAALISAGVTIGGQIIDRARRKAEAQRDEGSGAKAITDAAVALVKPQEERIAALERLVHEQSETIRDLQCQLEALRKLNIEYVAGIKLLVIQLESKGEKPIWKPETGSRT